MPRHNRFTIRPTRSQRRRQAARLRRRHTLAAHHQATNTDARVLRRSRGL